MKAWAAREKFFLDRLLEILENAVSYQQRGIITSNTDENRLS
jgi:hypothetical protein